VIKDVLLNGIADSKIRREALSTEGILAKSINGIVAFVESRGIARDANNLSNMSAISSTVAIPNKQLIPNDLIHQL